MPQKSYQEKVAQVLRDGAIALTKVAAERDALAEDNKKLASEVQALRLRREAEKVASDMGSKGLEPNVPFESLVERLEKKAHKDPHGFAVLRDAVGLVGPDMSKTAGIAGGMHAPADTTSDFERYILGDVSN